jgi:hypothetical protein
MCFSACENKEDDQIYSAQLCMDRATDGASADICLAKIAGVTTPQSYVLRCSGEFLRANITTSTIIQATQNLDQNSDSSTTDPSIQFYNDFQFNNATEAATAVNYCTLSGSRNLKLLAESAQLATQIQAALDAVAGGDLSTWIGTGDPSTLPADDLADIGNSVLSMQATACVEGGTFYGTEVCDNFAAATANSSDPATVGEAFINQLKNNNN